jgi:hypothetical protein
MVITVPSAVSIGKAGFTLRWIGRFHSRFRAVERSLRPFFSDGDT